ncbi:MAG TPA: hypothetical protein VI138_03700 [Candidatus Dormibacteraeota bacterium]
MPGELVWGRASGGRGGGGGLHQPALRDDAPGEQGHRPPDPSPEPLLQSLGGPDRLPRPGTEVDQDLLGDQGRDLAIPDQLEGLGGQPGPQALQGSRIRSFAVRIEGLPSNLWV